MCSISTNATIDNQLTSLGPREKNLIERRLFQFADDANLDRLGGLDNPGLIWKRRPQELRDVNARKLRIGRHRIYFTGSNKQCSYFAFCIKSFKKGGVDDEDDTKHQNRLINAMKDPTIRTLKKVTELDDSSDS